jgi:hypothetical protein
MIAFGCSIIAPDVYERYAKVGLAHAAEPDSAIYVHAAAGSIARSFNLMFDTAGRASSLEALVLVHEDAQIVDPQFCHKLRAAFSDPDVAVVGAIGASGVHDIAWWDGQVTWNSVVYRYDAFDGGDLYWQPETVEAPGEVDTIYGVVMAFSPWAVRNLRFDESVGMLHGYDFDVCRQARVAARKVITADLAIVHHHSLDLVDEIEIWVGAHMRAAGLWDTAGPVDPNDPAWRARARRAEADAAAARLLAASELLRTDAIAKQFADQQLRMEQSRSWRLTTALRRGNELRRGARDRLGRG